MKNNTVAIILSLLGSLTEAWHTYHTVLRMSALEDWQREVQAIIASIFISGGLLYFVIKYNLANSTDQRFKYKEMINRFTGISILINLYYWIAVLVIEPAFNNNWNWSSPEWYKLSIAIPLAIIIPLIIKGYAGEINFKEVIKPGKIKFKIGEKNYEGEILDNK